MTASEVLFYLIDQQKGGVTERKGGGGHIRYAQIFRSLVFVSRGHPHNIISFHIIISGKFHEILQALGLYSWIVKRVYIFFKSARRLHFFLQKFRYPDSICVLSLYLRFSRFLASYSTQFLLFFMPGLMYNIYITYIYLIISPDESWGYIGFRSVAPPPP